MGEHLCLEAAHFVSRTRSGSDHSTSLQSDGEGTKQVLGEENRGITRRSFEPAEIYLEHDMTQDFPRSIGIFRAKMKTARAAC